MAVIRGVYADVVIADGYNNCSFIFFFNQFLWFFKRSAAETRLIARTVQSRACSWQITGRRVPGTHATHSKKTGHRRKPAGDHVALKGFGGFFAPRGRDSRTIPPSRIERETRSRRQAKPYGKRPRRPVVNPSFGERCRPTRFRTYDTDANLAWSVTIFFALPTAKFLKILPLVTV